MDNYVPFQTPNLVWDSTIAIYLFLLGVAAGATLLAVFFKRSGKMADPSQSWIVRTSGVIAPAALTTGLVILIFHLTKPLTFWYLMFNYQFHSIMSMGVLLFQVYMAVLFLWLAIVFKALLAQLIERFLPPFKFVLNLLNLAEKAIQPIEWFLVVLSLLLGAYTGFLLSDLISYPMLNTLWLPALFLASGTSSGVAAVLIAVLLIGRVSTHSDEVKFLHKWEKPAVFTEIVLLVIFFANLYYGGGQQTASVVNAFASGWGTVFWVGVVGIGLVLPIVSNLIASDKLKHQKGFMLLLATATLVGVLCLRYFILYAGQMTIA